MKLAATERLVYGAALVAVVLAAVGALFADGDLEVTLVMVAAVIAGLVCFDTSMERRLKSFGPWLWLSIAPAAKTVPSVWFALLAADGDALVERYDHAGSLAYGSCVLIAVALLARPARILGRGAVLFNLVVILGSAATAAVAGASVAFLADQDFGSVAASRLLETPTWFVIGALLAAIVLAAAQVERPSLPLVGVLVTAAASAAWMAISVAGRDPDLGWWALLFAGFAVSAVGFGPGTLGVTADRTRQSNAGAAVAILAALIGAAAAIAARSDSAWGPGWPMLGVICVAMGTLAVVSTQPSKPQAGDQAEQAAVAKARALRTLRSAAVEDRGEASSNTPTTPRSLDTEASSPGVRGRLVSSAELTVARDERIASSGSGRGATTRLGADLGMQAEIAGEPRVMARAEAADQAVSASPNQHTTSAGRDARTVEPVVARRSNEAATSRTSQTELEHAHHVDPSTRLLSAAGLQHCLIHLFREPCRTAEVTIMIFTVRDLDEIEVEHGRLASAAVTREVAERMRTMLPGGTGARFGRAAYAVVFDGDLGDSADTVQRLAHVLLGLRAPVEGGSLGEKLDVVAAMAQCYEAEDAAQFIQRANQGLARAVQTAEPTFVAMP